MSIAKLALLLVPLAACGSHVDRNNPVDGSSPGEVLALMHGALMSIRSTPLPSPEVELVWLKPSEMSRISGAEHVGVTGLVSQFTLEIYSAPPDEMLEANAILDYRQIGMGLVIVGSELWDVRDMTTWRGADLDHMLIYFPESPPADSALTAFVHATTPPTAGFHLYTVTRPTEMERQTAKDCSFAAQRSGMDWAAIFRQCGGAGYDELDPAPGDMDTELSATVIDDDAVMQLVNDIPHPLGI